VYTVSTTVVSCFLVAGIDIVSGKLKTKVLS